MFSLLIHFGQQMAQLLKSLAYQIALKAPQQLPLITVWI
jgi:hypothetical protein